MKFIHLLSVLGLAAAFGVAHALPAGSSPALPQRLAPPSVVPPWLVAPGLDDEDPHEHVAPPPTLRVEKLERSRGDSVEEIHAGRQKLAGRRLRVRGTVVKLNEGILGKTYLHLRDGSGSAERGDHDLTATTTEAFELGETVELEGKLAIDQDVGAGYVYAALLTEATRVAR